MGRDSIEVILHRLNEMDEKLDALANQFVRKDIYKIRHAEIQKRLDDFESTTASQKALRATAWLAVITPLLTAAVFEITKLIH